MAKLIFQPNVYGSLANHGTWKTGKGAGGAEVVEHIRETVND